jgi:hypothetical protein
MSTEAEINAEMWYARQQEAAKKLDKLLDLPSGLFTVREVRTLSELSVDSASGVRRIERMYEKVSSIITAL